MGFGIPGIVSITGHFPVIEFLSLNAYPPGSVIVDTHKHTHAHLADEGLGASLPTNEVDVPQKASTWGHFLT